MLLQAFHHSAVCTGYLGSGSDINMREPVGPSGMRRVRKAIENAVREEQVSLEIKKEGVHLSKGMKARK